MAELINGVICECLWPECRVVVDGFAGCEHSCQLNECYAYTRVKAKPYSRNCLARDIPGASCLSPNCDC